MIFDNYVTNGTILTSTIWNRAWGFEGTAKSLYDSIGAQQHATNIYGAFSWSTAKQSLTTADTIVQFSFITVVVGGLDVPTFPSSERSGSLNNWKQGMIPTSDFRDRITIQRDGYYVVHAELSINDNTNRICSSTNVDGCKTVPDNSIVLKIIADGGNGVSTITKSSIVRPNVVKAATFNVSQNVAPHGSVVLNFVATFQKGANIKIETDVVDGAGRNERIVNAGLKAFLIKATDLNETDYSLY